MNNTKLDEITNLLTNKNSFEDLLSICVGKAYSNQLELRESLGDYKSWSVDVSIGKLFIDEKEFDVNFIGTTSKSDGMWFNADLEKAIPEEYLKAMFDAYENIEKHGLQELLPKKIKMDDLYTDHALAIIYTVLSGRETCYFKGSGDVSIFMTFNELPEAVLAPIDSTKKFLDRAMKIILTFNTNHRLMIKAFAISNEKEFNENEDAIVINFKDRDDSYLTFKFDEKNRIVNIKLQFGDRSYLTYKIDEKNTFVVTDSTIYK